MAYIHETPPTFSRGIGYLSIYEACYKFNIGFDSLYTSSPFIWFYLNHKECLVTTEIQKGRSHFKHVLSFAFLRTSSRISIIAEMPYIHTCSYNMLKLCYLLLRWTLMNPHARPKNNTLLWFLQGKHSVMWSRSLCTIYSSSSCAKVLQQGSVERFSFTWLI